ncbi:HAMP domain-containing sensor histidine kinase [Brevundimonas sp.]|uniref:sensor histidine kinase n=1 Tax=Brevundimonas sp. TaxID=1871086 RepID=UPI00184277D2|nr:HAMP domain-containing sensor histidine kinase [Brevundimonas sp.]MBA4807398.1 HAMP domain-containing histidine kinase [Brevundimonas sp.]
MKLDLTGFRIMGVLMLAVVVGMVGVLGIVSKGIDDHQRKLEEAVVGVRLARIVETIGEDLAPTMVWDEAVEGMTSPGAPQWFDRFVGGLFAGRHGHLATLGYDTSGRLIRMNHSDAPPHANPDHTLARAVAPLVSQIRAEARTRDRSAHGPAAVRVKTGFINVDGVIYVVGVSTIVRGTPNGLAPESDPVVASFKSFEAELDWIRNRLNIRSIRFQPETRTSDGMAGLEIRDASGVPIGQVVWTPERPGYRILTHALPVLLLMMTLLAVGSGILMWRMATDMRRLRASETALGGALQLAEAANAAKTRFLANVSHELRTPLNGVLGMAEVLSQEALTPRQRERLEILKASGHQQLRLIEELLDVVRLDDGAVKLENEEFRPDALLRRLVNDHGGGATAKGLKLKIETTVDGEWRGDVVHIEKLLATLVDNAIRFTASGEVILRALDHDGLIFEVQDTGAGMTKDEAARLFEAFAQGDESSTRSAEGLGLGLTVAYGLARLMGGRIEVESTPGFGSLMRVVLPLEPGFRSSAVAAA